MADFIGILKLQNAKLCMVYSKRPPKKAEKSGFSSVNFTGELQITDPEKFR
ncbi:hypothetical protein [Methylomonas sp. ZR1]|uniref:hypothetical protein n=1 Tax=Methylomonas sp. ZR1 TaxID=1797072 RepID=UPI001490F57D|nr:hypothetical protein [Methylomonas sp. ZR1]